MKKALLVGLAVFISIAFVTTVFAQAPAKETTTTTTTTTPATRTTPAKKETTTTTTTTTKSKGMRFRGEVTNMDMAAKMMTVKGKKGDMTFDVSNAKMKSEVKTGDRVTVKYMEKDGKMMASWVDMGRKAKKTKATETTTTTTTKTKEETTK